EARAQQSAGVVGNPPQPGLARLPALALGLGLGLLRIAGDALALVGALSAIVVEGLLHASLLRGIGVALPARFIVAGRLFRRMVRIGRLAPCASIVFGSFRCGRRSLAFSTAASIALPVGLLLLPVALAARGRLATQRRLHHGAVGHGVGHAGLASQRFVVSLERFFQAARARQCIAAVVGRVGPGQRGPGPGRLVITPGAIGL